MLLLWIFNWISRLCQPLETQGLSVRPPQAVLPLLICPSPSRHDRVTSPAQSSSMISGQDSHTSWPLWPLWLGACWKWSLGQELTPVGSLAPLLNHSSYSLSTGSFPSASKHTVLPPILKKHTFSWSQASPLSLFLFSSMATIPFNIVFFKGDE